MNIFNKQTLLARKKSKYDFTKRYFDGSALSLRKLFLLIFSFAIFLYLIVPYLKGLFSYRNAVILDSLERCLDDQLTPFYYQSSCFDVYISSSKQPLNTELKLLPYIGNGYIGCAITQNTQNLNIKINGRSINFPVLFYPFIEISPSTAKDDDGVVKRNESAFVIDYKSGFVRRYQCFHDFIISTEYYAHRIFPNILVQEMRVTNKRNQMININLDLPSMVNTQFKHHKSIKMELGSQTQELDVIYGLVGTNDEMQKNIAMTIAMQKFTSSNILLKNRGTTIIKNLLSISYSQPIKEEQYEAAQNKNEKRALDSLKKALQLYEDNGLKFKKMHTRVWNLIWNSGFSISTSLATSTINGDRINATIYVVMSQSRAFEYEDNVDPEMKALTIRAQNSVEGCYDSYHTLQTENLWQSLDTLEGINNLVSLWILTLEKQGCHHLVRSGSFGLIQAIVLSIGGFKFTNQHLEFNIHPKFLHRDFQFRRIKYGDHTNMNVSVSVKENNKAILSVQINSTDGKFYVCDAACLDEPVVVELVTNIFPVKLTEPLTAILYITDNKKHIDELHKAIHVKEVVEAPPHEKHLIALHRHGHHLGGLPAFFWLSISILVIVFHIFLCKLIIKEYCEPTDKFRYRYNKA